jgi:hypothetical protein
MSVISARRLIRRKGSNVAVLVGSSGQFADITQLIAFARKAKRVYAYVDSNGNQGTVRSGRVMRRVDAHVRNTVTFGEGIQIPLDFQKELGAVPVLNPLSNLFDSSEMGTENPFESSNREADKAWAEHLSNS